MIQKTLKSIVRDHSYFLNFYLTAENVIAKPLRNPQGYEITSELTSAGNYRFSIYDVKNDVRCCTCIVMFGQRYIEQRDYFSLQPNEGELGYLYTLDDYQGQGLATTLLSEAQQLASARGLTKLYCRIWYTNTASIRAFEKSGWRPHSRYFGLRLFNFPAKGVFIPTLNRLKVG